MLKKKKCRGAEPQSVLSGRPTTNQPSTSHVVCVIVRLVLVTAIPGFVLFFFAPSFFILFYYYFSPPCLRLRLGTLLPNNYTDVFPSGKDAAFPSPHRVIE